MKSGSTSALKSSKKIHLLMSASVMAISFVISPAFGQSITITNKRETPISTSTADGGSPANIIVDDDGEIEVSSGTAVSVDSDNTVKVDGILDNRTISNGIGVHYQTEMGETLISGYSGIGDISVGSIDNDNNVGSNNFGILIDGDGTFQGDIIGSRNADFTVRGTNSAGISVQTNMIGNISIDDLTVGNANSNGIKILGNLTGNIEVNNRLDVDAEGSHGIYIGADVDGQIRNIGFIDAGKDITRDIRFNEVPAVGAIAAIRVSSNLTGGIANDIIFQDSNGNIVELNENESTSGYSRNNGTLNAFAGGQTILITPEKVSSTGWTDITIGNTGSLYGDYSIVNQRNILASGRNTGQDVTSILITGASQGGTDYTATLDFGIYNGLWGEIDTQTIDADATTLRIGAGASVPEFINNGMVDTKVIASVDDEGNFNGDGGNAYGIVIDQGGFLQSFENSGVFTVEAGGNNQEAVGILDRSGTLSNFSNTNLFSVRSSANDSVLTAVDLSNNSTGITFYNSGIIEGDIYLGNGVNNITLEGLSTSEIATRTQDFIDADLTEDEYLPLLERDIEGTIFLKGGSATLEMSDNSALRGGIVSPNGNLDITLRDQSELSVNTDLGLNATNIDILDQSVIKINIQSVDNFVGGINASGTVEFSPQSNLDISVLGIVLNEETFNIVTAGNLIIDDDVNIQNLGSTLFVYDLEAEHVGNDINLNVRRRTSEELGLSETFGNIYEASIGAFGADDDVARYLGSIETEEDFYTFYRSLMPLGFSQATNQAIRNTNNISLGAVSSQLDGLRRLIKRAPPSRVLNGVWIQEFAGIYDYDGGIHERGSNTFNFGLAAGYEFAASDRGVIGASISYNIADIKFSGEADDRLAVQNAQIGLYSAFWLENFFLENQASIGYLDFSGDRFVSLGDDLREINSDWNGLQYSGNIKAGYEFELGPIAITPTAVLNYINVKQKEYTEVNGGPALNLNVLENNRDSLTTDLKLEVAHRTEFMTDSVVNSVMSIVLQGGWSQQLKDDPIEMTAKFASTDEFFKIYGDPIDKNSFQAGLGVYFTANYFAFTIRYDAEWRDQYLGHSANMNIRARF
jgi:uncharacterized protein YhjY with autotransporter beta-barrel domain